MPRQQRRQENRRIAKAIERRWNRIISARDAQEHWKSLLGQTGVACLAESPVDMPMWGYYANSHRGYVLEFATSAQPFILANRVVYDAERPRFRVLDPDRRDLMERLLLRKAAVWGHEHEWRVVQAGRTEPVTFPPELLKSITFGAIGGVRQKIHYFCMDLPQSDAPFVKAYPRETTEAFLDGHVSAFAFFGGVPLSILYDNTTIAVAKICGDGKRERTRAFTELCSHYLFRDRFARPAKGNDKGKVEGLVKHARMNFMVPIPEAASFDELNVTFADRCRARQSERAGRHAETIGERLVADSAVLRSPPAVPLEPCEKRSGRVSSMALVRYRTNDYSVPTAYGFQDVVVKGFVAEVVILCGGKEIARHQRCYGEGVFVADPLHYLALIETKPGALDQAAALQDWALPDVFQHLRNLLEARMGNRGKREFIQVLRLLEALPLDIVTGAVTQAIQIGAVGFDAIKLIALARIERRPARLDLAAYPHLPRTAVKTTSAADYAVLAA